MKIDLKSYDVNEASDKISYLTEHHTFHEIFDMLLKNSNNIWRPSSLSELTPMQWYLIRG